VRVGVTVLSATPRSFEAQSKTAEMPSRLIHQHGNEINTEQFTTGVDRVLQSLYVCVGYSVEISEVFSASELYILLIVHLVKIFVNNQLDAQFFFLINLYQFSTCFEQPCAHHQESQLYQYSIQMCIPHGHPHRVAYTRCRIDTTDSPDDEHKAA